MPISGGTAGAHDDAMHQGSAKRDVVDGVAGIDSGGDVLAVNSGIRLTRDGFENIFIIERTGGDQTFTQIRIGANSYSTYVKIAGSWEKVQTDDLKDVVSGIAALDASGHLLIPSYRIYAARGGAGQVTFRERTSDERMMRLIRNGANDYEGRINVAGTEQRILTMRDLCVEEYSNHLGAVDNFIQTETGGNGTANVDAANHEMDLSSGITVADGYARLESKKTFALGTAPLVLNFIINNVQNGVGAGGDLILVGFISATGFPGESYSVGFYKDSADAWHCLTNSSGVNSTKTGISAPSNGDLLTIIATSASVKFYENGVLLATHTTNIPTSNNCIGAAVYGDAQTTAVLVSLDMMSMKRYRA
jgi:hypothetical protein